MLNPRLVALVGVVTISFTAIWVRAAGVSPGTSVFFRGAYALPALLVLTGLVYRHADRRSPRARGLAVAAGVILALDLNFLHRSIDYVGAGLATVLLSLQVLMVPVAAWLLLKERPSRAALLAAPLALAGVVLTTGAGRADAYGASPLLGGVFGVLAAVMYTGYLLVFRESTRSVTTPGSGPLLDVTLGAVAAGAVLGVLLDPGFSLVPSWPAHGWLVVLALLSHTFAWLLIASALPRLPVAVTSVLLLLQPCLAMVWGRVFFAEAPSLVQWAGVALVIAAVAIVSLGKIPTGAHPPDEEAAAVEAPSPRAR